MTSSSNKLTWALVGLAGILVLAGAAPLPETWTAGCTIGALACIVVLTGLTARRGFARLKASRDASSNDARTTRALTQALSAPLACIASFLVTSSFLFEDDAAVAAFRLAGAALAFAAAGTAFHANGSARRH